jgi:hypothetical protein
MIRIVLWPVLAFASSMLYFFVAISFFEQRLEKFREKPGPDEIQTLGLGK